MATWEGQSYQLQFVGCCWGSPALCVCGILSFAEDSSKTIGLIFWKQPRYTAETTQFLLQIIIALSRSPAAVSCIWQLYYIKNFGVIFTSSVLWFPHRATSLTWDEKTTYELLPHVQMRQIFKDNKNMPSVKQREN